MKALLFLGLLVFVGFLSYKGAESMLLSSGVKLQSPVIH